jgi:RNA polymerase primary sigma factor
MLHGQDRQASLSFLDQYIREVKWIPPLTDEEEACLLQQIECDQARVRLIEGYQGLVLKLAKRYRQHCHELELLDLVQEGNLGLLRALERYDGRIHETSFHTWAYSWVRGMMFSALLREGAFHLPARTARLIRQMNKVKRSLLFLLGREPTIAETAADMQISEREVRELLVLEEQREVLRLHMPLNEEGDTALEDIIADPAAAAVTDEGFSTVEDILGCLAESERAVLLLRYGFGDRCAHTQREVAEQLGLTSSLVRVIEQRARKQLRRALARAAS